MRRRLAALLALVALLALSVPLAGCGGDEDSSSSGGSAAAPAEAGPGRDAEPGGVAGGADANRRGGAATGGDQAAKAGDGTTAPGSSGSVDLTVRPGSIRGARVTPSGAVQTLPPSEEAQDTAQANSYPSIKAFGEEATGEEATNVTFALVQYLTAKATGDWATACARLYGPLRENLERAEGGDCASAFGELMSRVPPESRAEQAKIDVSSIRRGDGNRAFVIYKTPDTLSADMPMYVEDGAWKVGALEAYVLTPGQAG